MSETETTATVSAPAAPKAKKAPKPLRKAAAKPSANGHRKEGLRKPQIAVLAALNKSGRALTRSEIAAKAKTDLAFLSTWIGSSDPETRKANDQKRGVKSLLTLGYVRHEQPSDEAGAACYSITANGRKALEKAE